MTQAVWSSYFNAFELFHKSHFLWTQASKLFSLSNAEEFNTADLKYCRLLKLVLLGGQFFGNTLTVNCRNLLAKTKVLNCAEAVLHRNLLIRLDRKKQGLRFLICSIVWAGHETKSIWLGISAKRVWIQLRTELSSSPLKGLKAVVLLNSTRIF